MQRAKREVQSAECGVQVASKSIALGLVMAVGMTLARAPLALAGDERTAAGHAESQIQNPQPEPPVLSRTVTLSDAVEIALTNSPRVQAQAAEVAATRARAGIARAATKLQVSTATFATTGTMPNIIAGPPGVEPTPLTAIPDRARLDQNVMGMYPIYTGGRLKAQLRSAEALVGAAASDARSSELDTALNAKTAFRRVLLGQRIMDAYQKRVDEARERVRIAEAAFEQGRIARFDLLRNQTELAEAEQALVNAQRDADIALVDLKSALGVSQASTLTPSGELTFEAPAGTLREAEPTALARRPEIAAARARLRSAEAGLRATSSGYRPQVYAVGMQDFSVQSADSFERGFTVGIAAAIPLYDAGRRRSEVAESQAVLARARAEEREAVLTVTHDVAASWAGLQAAAKNVTFSQTAVQQAEEDYRVIRLRYEAGKATNVEVLDAIAALTRARTNQAQALFDYNTARDQLARATGET